MSQTGNRLWTRETAAGDIAIDPRGVNPAAPGKVRLSDSLSLHNDLEFCFHGLRPFCWWLCFFVRITYNACIFMPFLVFPMGASKPGGLGEQTKKGGGANALHRRANPPKDLAEII